MGRRLTDEKLQQHKEEALSRLSHYIDSLVENNDYKIKSKSDKLSYWLEDWCKFLEYEDHFSPSSLRRYKRGEIIKAHLGYNVGSEEGGLHYCVVLDKKNSKNSPVITIVPLTSRKPKTDVDHLHPGSVYLGNELFTNLRSKIVTTRNMLGNQLNRLKSLVNDFDSLDEDKQKSFLRDLDEAEEELILIQKMSEEIEKMKLGSIALVSQITTISKIRIYDPKTNHDILSNVKLSNEKLDIIDKEMMKLFTK